jgi:EpsI family protein
MALAGSHWSRALESAKLDQPDFLKNLSLPFRDWQPKDLPLSKGELGQLEPDATLVRDYQSTDGQKLNFKVIAGHRKKTVHTPSSCMTSEGWETTEAQALPIDLAGQRVDATRSVMFKEGQSVLATYTFTDGDYSSGNLSKFQMVQLFRRFRANVPIGALVRIVVPINGDREAAAKISDEFAAANLPAVLGSLRNAHVRAN